MRKFFKTSILALLTVISTQVSFAQDNTGTIQLTAVFSNSILLNVTEGASITFVVDELSKYQNGVVATDTSTFNVSATADYQVSMAATSFVSGEDSLDANNFGVKIFNAGTHTVGQNANVILPTGTQLLGTEQTIVNSGALGNRGGTSANTFKLLFELGTQDVQDAQTNKLGTLLSQGIVPGSYVGTVTLTASALNEGV